MRPQRKNAGNIYKKRRDEIRQVVPRVKKKTESKTSRPKPHDTRGSSGGGGGGSSTVRSPAKTVTVKKVTKSKAKPQQDKMEEKETKPIEKKQIISQSPPPKSTITISKPRAKQKPQKKFLNDKYKCQFCGVSFAEQRYVEFHIQQRHPNNKIDRQQEPVHEISQEEEEEDELYSHEEDDVNLLPVEKNSEVENIEVQPDFIQDEEEDVEQDAEGQQNMFNIMETVDNFFGDAIKQNSEEYYEKISPEEYKCKLCVDYRLSSEFKMMTHVQRHIANALGHRCPYCTFRSKDRTSLQVHMYQHTGVEPFCCKVCDHSFKSTHQLLHHCKTSHSENAIAAAQTSKLEKNSPQKSSPPRSRVPPALVFSTDTKEGLPRFIGLPIPSSQKRHKCPYCPQLFMSEVNLETHVSVHKLKGITDEEMEEELRTQHQLLNKFGDDIKNFSTEEYDVTLPISGFSVSRIKRRPSTSVYPPGKRRKELPTTISSSDEQVAGVCPIVDGPPRCKVCNRTFLYTTSLERHMREDHPEPAEIQNIKVLPSPPPVLEVSTPPSLKSILPKLDAVKEENTVSVAVASTTKPPTIKLQLASNLTRSSTTIASQSQPTSTSIVTIAAQPPTGRPLKSVYLLLDPSSNTLIPVAPSLLGLREDNSLPIPGSPKPVVITNVQTLAPPTAQVQPSTSEPQPQLSAEAIVDQELAVELARLGTPGTPLSAGADNQHIEKECTVCHEKILGYTEIVKHFHTHTVGDDFVCHICNKRFSSKSSLGVHFLIHIGITFSCPLCNKKLAKKQSLLEHLRFHKGERRHICNECGKGFINSSSLNRHMKMHTVEEFQATNSDSNGSQIVKCPMCPRKFRESELPNHLKAHTIIKQFESSSSTQVSSEKPAPTTTVVLPCQYCGKIWGSAVGLRRHLKQEHHHVDIKSSSSESPQVIIPQTSTQPLVPNIIDIIEVTDDEEIKGKEQRTLLNQNEDGTQVTSVDDGGSKIGN